jgi:hypothetical protein
VIKKNKKIIKLKTEISNLRWKSLGKRISDFLNSTQKVPCKWLNKRPVFVDEYLLFTDSRNSPDKNHRKQCFFSCIELLKKVKKEHLTNMRVNGWKVSYEFKWITPKWSLVTVHIIEFSSKKDKKLKLISTFWDNKRA